VIVYIFIHAIVVNCELRANHDGQCILRGFGIVLMIRVGKEKQIKQKKRRRCKGELVVSKIIYTILLQIF
jgi:hypothetical protein